MQKAAKCRFSIFDSESKACVKPACPYFFLNSQDNQSLNESLVYVFWHKLKLFLETIFCE